MTRASSTLGEEQNHARAGDGPALPQPGNAPRRQGGGPDASTAHSPFPLEDRSHPGGLEDPRRGRRGQGTGGSKPFPAAHPPSPVPSPSWALVTRPRSRAGCRSRWPGLVAWGPGRPPPKTRTPPLAAAHLPGHPDYPAVPGGRALPGGPRGNKALMGTLEGRQVPNTSVRRGPDGKKQVARGREEAGLGTPKGGAQ